MTVILESRGDWVLTETKSSFPFVYEYSVARVVNGEHRNIKCFEHSVAGLNAARKNLASK